MGLLDLLIASSVPVLNVLLVTFVGSILATGRIDILSEVARKHLNNMVFYVFNPALVSTNLARTITFESMVSLWFMPINIFLTFAIGSALGWIVIQITKTPSHLKGLILGCCSAGNLGNMLLIIIPALCKEKGSHFGDPDVCYSYGLAYSSLSMAIGAIFLWSYVYNIMRAFSSTNGGGENRNIQNVEFPDESYKLPPRTCINGTSSTKDTISSDYSIDEYALLLSRCEVSSAKRKVAGSSKINQFLGKLVTTIDLKKLFAPSTLGVIVGFIVGVIPQIRKSMIGETAPLRVINESTTLLGNGAIPTATLIMGGNLTKGLRGSDIRFSLVAGVVVVRYIALPLLGLVVVKGAVHLGLVHSDPLYQFILLLQYALPPAMNIGTITQLFGTGESECSVIFLWTYSLASIALTLWSTLFLWIVS